jgi:hypothetical protein
VLGEYLNWTGNKGGPLVTSHNDTMNSDLRLYESDKNATMRALFAQGTGFLNTCVDLLGRTIDTVPSGVELGQTITPMPIKPINVTFDIGANGTLMLSGIIRILTAADTAPPTSLTIRVSGHDTTHFPFLISGPRLRNATFFSITGSTISEQTFSYDSNVYVVPSLTTLEGTTFDTTVAIPASQACEKYKLKLSSPFRQQGTLAPKMSEMDIEVDEATGSGAGYRFCRGVGVLNDVPTGLVTVKILDGEEVVDTLLVNGGNAGW